MTRVKYNLEHKYIEDRISVDPVSKVQYRDYYVYTPVEFSYLSYYVQIDLSKGNTFLIDCRIADLTFLDVSFINHIEGVQRFELIIKSNNQYVNVNFKRSMTGYEVVFLWPYNKYIHYEDEWDDMVQAFSFTKTEIQNTPIYFCVSSRWFKY